MTIRSTFSLLRSKLTYGLIAEERLDKHGHARIELGDGRWIEVSVEGGQDFRVRASGGVTIEPNCTNDLILRVST